MKIGFLSFYYPHLGGSGIVATRMAKYLAEQGYEVHFIGYDSDINPKEMEELGIKLHKVDKVDYPCLKNEPYAWTLASKLCEVHEKHDLDLVHVNYAIPHALAAFAAREHLKTKGKYLPYIVTCHGSDIHTNGYKQSVNPILKLCLNKADSITYVSKALKKLAKETLGIEKEGKFIENFVDPTIFYKKKTDLRKQLGIPTNAFVIGHASNFAPIKQVYHFSKLAKNLKNKKQLRNVFFLMCGKGRDWSKLKREVKKLKVDSHFIFLGRLKQEEMREAYNAMDVFVLTSKNEGVPLVILEAMACGKPIVSTDVGGIADTIGKRAGFLFNPEKIEKLADLIKKLQNNKKLCANIGEEAIIKTEKEYSIDRIMQKYYNLYSSVVMGNKIRSFGRVIKNIYGGNKNSNKIRIGGIKLNVDNHEEIKPFFSIPKAK